MSKINYPLLRKVREMILKRPRQFEMAGFFEGVLFGVGGADIEVPSTNPSHCGTACCIGGWAITLQQMPKIPMPSKANYEFMKAGRDAQRVLGLTGPQANRLFYVDSWPKKHQNAHDAAKTYKERAEAGAARVATFIRTRGEV